MILKDKLEKEKLNIKIKENFIKPSFLDKNMKVEYLIFEIDNVQYELSCSKITKLIYSYALSSNWEIIYGGSNFNEIIKEIKNNERY